jgi:UDP-N-acetylglucosamine 2-epimerase (non-hydrolysing)
VRGMLAYFGSPMTRPSPTAAHVVVIVGTRPEAIKLAPVVRALRRGEWARVTVVDTGQHHELAVRALALTAIAADVSLTITRIEHTLTELMTGLLGGIDGVLATAGAEAVLVQGDTTSAFAGALAAFHRGIPVGHVEAGLRSGEPRLPFPEEANRRMIAALSNLHFAPTRRARDNLLAEGVPPLSIVLSGNTIVDELQRTLALSDAAPHQAPAGRRLMVVTLHRRESLGAPLESVLRAVGRIADAHPDLDVWFPMHANPLVREPARAVLGAHPRVTLASAADYPVFLRTLEGADLVVTDSGGVTEEATELGVRTLVVRARTERPEAIEAGIAELVGVEEEAIVAAAAHALALPAPPRGSGVFGDGDASERIVAALRERLRPSSGVEVEEHGSVVLD